MMELLMQGVSLSFSALLLLLTVLAVLSLRHERPISPVAPLLTIFTGVVILVAHLLLSGAKLRPLLAAPLLILGLVFGGLRGLGLRLARREGQIVGRESLLFAGLWGMSLALSQLLNSSTSSLLAAAGLAPLFFSTGGQVGLSGIVFLRRMALEGRGR